MKPLSGEHALAADPVAETLRGLRAPCLSVLAKFRIPPEDAEDLLQDALVLLLRKGDAVRHPELWVPATLRNLCLHYWRSRRRATAVGADPALLERAADLRSPEWLAFEQRHDLAVLIARLPESCRTLLRLRYQAGLDSAGIAAALGCKPGSVGKLAQRCLARLRAAAAVPPRRPAPRAPRRVPA